MVITQAVNTTLLTDKVKLDNAEEKDMSSLFDIVGAGLASSVNESKLQPQGRRSSSSDS